MFFSVVLVLKVNITKMLVTSILLLLSSLVSAKNCQDAIATVNLQRSELKKVERQLHTKSQSSNLKFVACFISHYPLVQYGCESTNSKLIQNGEKSHIRARIQFHDIANTGLIESKDLQNAIDEAHEICQTDPKLQSTNFEGHVVCLNTACEIVRLAYKNELDGAIDAKEIEPQRDDRQGVGLDEIFRLD